MRGGVFRLSAFAVLLLALPADAAPRDYGIGSFDRLRVDGPFRVVLTTGRAPAARAEGDERAIDAIDVRVEGDTLIVRGGPGAWNRQPGAEQSGAAVIRLSTGMIHSASLIGGGDVTITGPLKGQRIDLTLTGSGSLGADGIDADVFTASVIGSGRMTLAGRAARARLGTNGPAEIKADRLVVGDLAVATSGNGELTVQARFTAAVTAAGHGAVTVYGKPACTVRGAGAAVSCGKVMPPAVPAP